jgi:hypothetical protein
MGAKKRTTENIHIQVLLDKRPAHFPSLWVFSSDGAHIAHM